MSGLHVMPLTATSRSMALQLINDGILQSGNRGHQQEQQQQQATDQPGTAET